MVINVISGINWVYHKFTKVLGFECSEACLPKRNMRSVGTGVLALPVYYFGILIRLPCYNLPWTQSSRF